MRHTIIAFATLAAVAAAPARAGPVVLKPSSPWNVEFADNKCRLARLFGEGEKQHLLYFEK